MRIRGRSVSLALVIVAACAAPSELTSPIARHAGRDAGVVIPPVGSAATLDIGNWNIEWFGDPANGPTNEALQQSNVKDVIAGADVDIWGFEEVVSATAWNNMEAALPGYTGFLANESFVTNGPQFYSDFSNTEQKVGILYKSSVATLISAQVILTAQDFNFAGRPPLEVKLRVNLNGVQEDVVVIVLHNKCCTDSDSWTRRRDAANALKAYLDATYPTQKVWVIGDWNDDLDTSISPGQASPFAAFTNDPARYTFPTRALTNAGVSSTTGFPDFIDHQLHTNEINAIYEANSANVIRADQQISNYSTTTTDHYPVYSRYNWGTVSTTPSVTVSAPNGGESWQAGTSQNITWSSANVSTVKLEYSLDGTTWTTISASTPASPATFAWTVPNTPSTTARVRVSDVSSTATDQSDGTFSITTAPPPPTGPANVIINEIMANEPGSSTAGEYVELVNVGGTAESIGGWTIRDGKGNTIRHTFAAGTMLQPGQAIVVFGAASGIPAGTPNAIASSTGSLSLNNSSDKVHLRNGSTTVTSVSYGTSLASTDGVSMNRSPDLSPTGAMVLHTSLSTLNGSPGRRANGTDF
jgi:hypothetical protein